jgi:hypothetical protein
MNRLVRILAALVGLVLVSGLVVAGGAPDSPVCRAANGLAAPNPAPARVLLVPLLKGDPDERQPETWPNRPVAQLAGFYRTRFRAETTRMTGVRTWSGFLNKAWRLMDRGESFDRIILIGHGGLDGPVLNDDTVVMERTEDGAEARALRIVEAQPGLADVLTITYIIGVDSARNFARRTRSKKEGRWP